MHSDKLGNDTSSGSKNFMVVFTLTIALLFSLECNSCFQVITDFERL